MKELFKIVRGLCDVDGMKMVDRDNKQLDKYDTKPPVAFPCTLIRIVISSCESITTKTQLCSGRATIRVASDLAKSETSADAPDAASERTLSAYYDLAQDVYEALQGYRIDPVKSFDRVSMMDEVRNDGLNVVKMEFDFSFFDTSAED